jgi:acetoin utilization deacetylase AcuC-like enzyme
LRQIGIVALRRTGFVFAERYLWHDSCGGRFPLQPSPSFENPETKRRFRNLLAATGILDRLVAIKPAPASEEDVARFHTREYIESIKYMSAIRGDAGELGPVRSGQL